MIHLQKPIGCRRVALRETRNADAKAARIAVALELADEAHQVCRERQLAQTPPERGQIAIKYLDYLDSQPGASRVRVQAAALADGS